MINEHIDEQTRRNIMLFLFIASILILIYGSFRLGEFYICKKSGMELMLEPEVKCATQEEIEIIKNPLGWLYENRTINQTICT